MPLRTWLLCLLAALTACTAHGPPSLQSQVPNPQSPNSYPPLAFIAVNVLPMTPGEPLLPDHDVLIENGRIAALGPAGSIRIPRDAQRIPGNGRYLMPGLADMHVHLEHFDNPAYLGLFLANGVTMVRSMDGRPEILDWRRRIAAGTLIGPDIHTAGPVLDGNPPVRDDNLALATPEEARRAVADQAAAGYDFIKVYANLSPEVFRAIMAEAAARNLPVVGHAPRAVGLDAFLASGISALEHTSDSADSIAAVPQPDPAPPAILRRRLGFPADPARIEALAARIAASGVWVVPTIITDDRLVATEADVETWSAAPEMAAVDRGIAAWWRGTVGRAAARLAPDEWRWVAQGRANRLALLRAFHRAGVNLLIGTDTPNPFVFPGASIHDELANYVAAGLTPAQALAAATREPARFRGQDRIWGTVAPGMGASLLLLEANPLEDIASTRRIAGVVAGGRWLPLERLRQMRDEVARVAAASQ